ncbi:hypothetical protein V6N12_056735 [Hibiscus sabdariffa]|uniref:Uncharacterized protein n=1 Tax=Hibiscus sabdariffa TaxID=183260 RepID=A0ABR2DES8_9ROSI
MTHSKEPNSQEAATNRRKKPGPHNPFLSTVRIPCHNWNTNTSHQGSTIATRGLRSISNHPINFETNLLRVCVLLFRCVRDGVSVFAGRDKDGEEGYCRRIRRT